MSQGSTSLSAGTRSRRSRRPGMAGIFACLISRPCPAAGLPNRRLAGLSAAAISLCRDSFLRFCPMPGEAALQSLHHVDDQRLPRRGSNRDVFPLSFASINASRRSSRKTVWSAPRSTPEAHHRHVRSSRLA